MLPEHETARSGGAELPAGTRRQARLRRRALQSRAVPLFSQKLRGRAAVAKPGGSAGRPFNRRVQQPGSGAADHEQV